MDKENKSELRDLRRKDRALTDHEAWQILEQGTYGVLATVDKQMQVHGTPLSYMADKEGACIYVHCAKTGQKVDNLDWNPRVCFTVVKGVTPTFKNDPVNYTMHYISVMAYGHAQRLSGDDKKKAAIMLVKKYFPENVKQADGYYNQTESYVDVWKISINRVTAKANPARIKTSDT